MANSVEEISACLRFLMVYWMALSTASRTDKKVEGIQKMGRDIYDILDGGNLVGCTVAY